MIHQAENCDHASPIDWIRHWWLVILIIGLAIAAGSLTIVSAIGLFVGAL